MPPSETALQESLLLVLTGFEEDLAKGYQKELGVPVGVFRRAHEYIRRCNKAYSEGFWDEEQGPSRLSCDEQVLGLPRVLARCLRRQAPVDGEVTRVRQQGPADAPDGVIGGEVDVDEAVGCSGEEGHVGGSGGGEDTEGASLGVDAVMGTLSALQVWFEEHAGKMPRFAGWGDPELVV